ncbi:MAG: CHAT domain-containing protein [Moorea sp. SIOASIH]|uniref:CHAT domain-containing protein n=1 Tax=Moorena sp. SIOASIH TaxID=2607817 RepID=UPI0013B9CF79|nr:CHAT domain-containing tetratricopeptide repeat protein [Moorena sp. SIOASIH]NEO41202.1 CHAT domain-containing protein [Moorena sp. SIOASIH]
MAIPDNTSDTQLDFLLKVLKATTESRGDKQVVYPLLAANIEKLNHKLAEKLRAFATSKLAEVKPYQSKLLAADIGSFSTLIQELPLGDKASNIEIAITGYEVVLTVFTREAFPEIWATIQYNLGNAYRDRIKSEKAQNIEEAIACYQQALRVYTFEAFPETWAITKDNLGAAYSDRIKGEKAQNIEEAIACYQKALRVYTFEAFPQQWAMTQYNLGNAYRDRIKGDKAQNIEEAIACYQQALRVRTFEAFPQQWARTQNNLGIAYGDRIKGEKAQNIEEAIACFQQAIIVRTFEAFPLDWARTQNNLGIAYNQRIKGDKAQNLEDGITCLQQALRVYTFEAFPQQWAMTQNNLGIAYRDRIKGDKAQNIEEAITCYQKALRAYTFEAFPVDLSTTQNNLGIAYGNRIKGDKAQNIEDAIACYQQALKVTTFEAFTQSHAETLFNLGLAYKGSNQFTLAYSTLASAIATVESLREEIVSGQESKRKQAEEWNTLYISMVEVCLEFKNITEAIDYVERSKTRNLVEEIISRDLNTIFPPEVVNKLEQYRDEIAAGQNQIQQGKADNPTALAQRLKELRQQRNDLQDQYLPIGSSFNFEQFQNNLDHYTAIIEFYITGDKLLTLIFTRQTQQPIVLQSEPQDLEKLGNWINEYLRSYYTETSDWQNDLSKHLHGLADILSIDDIIQQIPERCDRLILIPHRYLHLLPLHALPITSKQGEGNSKILMEQFPAGVSYAPSCQLLQLAKTRKRPKDFTHLFAVQNPSADLVYTTIEVDVIKSYFNPPPDTEVLVEKAATKAAIDSKALNTFHCAHFSCHGYFNYQEPRKSALILANAHKPASAESNSERYLRVSEEEVFDLDKCLTIDEVFGLQLEQCRLVTLSACETGLIDYTNSSDEYIGLPSGFLVAGSPAVVSSLWMVNDLSTALLMIKFYQNLREQIPLAVALNQAQFWLRDSTQSQLLAWSRKLSIDSSSIKKIEQALDWFNPDEQPFQNPYYWAAFCVLGE